jgi:hypothetical protein
MLCDSGRPINRAIAFNHVRRSLGQGYALAVAFEQGLNKVSSKFADSLKCSLTVGRVPRAAQRRSTLPTVVAWGQAGFSAEELCKMTWVRVANIEGNIDNTHLRFAKQLSRDVHPQINVIALSTRCRVILGVLEAGILSPRLALRPVRVADLRSLIQF